MANNTSITERLFAMQEAVYREKENYREFQARILVIDPESIIGIRTPVLRKFAKQIQGTAEAAEFMRDLPHFYHEEKQLHSFLVGECKDFDEAVDALDKWLPYVDNWASCDCIGPKVFAKYVKKLYADGQPVAEDRLLAHIDRWLASGHCYTIRFSILCLMNFYLGEAFSIKHLDKVAAFADSEEYYVRMMVAWYLSFALVKQWDATIPLMESRSLPKWTHNKTIQKAVESFRISDDRKAYLKTLREKCKK